MLIQLNLNTAIFNLLNFEEQIKYAVRKYILICLLKDKTIDSE